MDECELKNVVTVHHSSTNFSMIGSDTFKDQKKGNGSLQVSILCGLIELTGPYLNNLDKGASRQSSFHWQCECQTAFKRLNTEQLLKNVRYNQMKTTGRIAYATHFVTQIQYGAAATFTFTKQLGETENEREVNTQLESVVRKFAKYLRKDPNVGGNCVDTSPENDKTIKFHYEGDYNLPNDVKHPTTYEEAIEFAKKFWSSLSKWMDKDPENENQSLGVPITVWLTPLVTMPRCHEAPVLRYEIPRWMASKCVSFMRDYDEVEDRLHGMLQDPLVKKLIPLEKKLQWFKECLDTFLEVLKLKLREIVVNFRSGQITALDSFRQLVSQIENEDFIFHYERLDGWLHRKFSELTLVKKIQQHIETKIGKRECLIFPSPETLKEKMTNYPAKFGYEFSFSFTARPEEFLERLKRTVIGTDIFNEIAISTETNNSNDKHWYESSSVFERIQSEIDIFVKLVKSNTNDEKFAITATDNYDENRVNQFPIIVHHNRERMFGLSAMEFCGCIVKDANQLGDGATTFSIGKRIPG